MFGKPVSKLSTKDLTDLLADRAIENVRLEFKRAAPSKDELLKKLTSMANTFGGCLIVGAEANSSDSRLSALPGIDVIPGFRQQTFQRCYDGVYPPLDVEVSEPIDCEAGKKRVCYIVHVPESDQAPHFMNGRKGVWIRTDEHSQRFEPRLATLPELTQLLSRREPILQRRQALIARARTRFLTTASQGGTETETGRGKVGATAQLSIVPRYPSKKRCGHLELYDHLQKLSVEWRSADFPRAHQRPITQHESVVLASPFGRVSTLETNVWGLHHLGMEVEGQSDREGTVGIHLNRFLGDVLVFLEHTRQVMKWMGTEGPVHLELALQSVQGVPWIHFPNRYAKKGPSSVIDDTVQIELSSTADLLIEDRNSLAKDVFRTVFLAMNWPEAARDDEVLDRLVGFGCQYNMWGAPDS